MISQTACIERLTASKQMTNIPPSSSFAAAAAAAATVNGGRTAASQHTSPVGT